MTTRVRALLRTSVKTMAGLTLFYRTRIRRRVLQHARLCIPSLAAYVSYLPSVSSPKSNHSPPSSIIFPPVLPPVQQPRYVISSRCHELESLVDVCKVFKGNVTTACINFLMSMYTKHLLWTTELTHAVSHSCIDNAVLPASRSAARGGE